MLKMHRWRWFAWSAALAMTGLICASPFWIEKRLPAPAVAPPPPNERVLTGRIGRNGSLDASLANFGLEPLRRSKIADAFRRVFDPRHARPSDQYEVRLSPEGELKSIKYWPDGRDYVWLRPQGAGFAARRLTAPKSETVVGAAGAVNSTLWDAMIAQGIPADVIMKFADVFAWQVDFLTEVRPGDRFRLAWTRVDTGRSHGDGEILAAEYHGGLAGDRSAYYFAGSYYDQDGESLKKEFLRAPLNYRRISSRFTERRYHPILKYYRPHHGIDYAAAYGTPVVAIGAGVVTQTGTNGGIGRMIEVRHNSTFASIYGHLSGYASGVRPGKRVEQGQVIGYVGSTGLSTGPHLHFGFKRNGQLINFFSLKIPTQKRVSSADRPRFEEAKRQSQDLLAQIRSPGAPLIVRRPAAGVSGGASR